MGQRDVELEAFGDGALGAAILQRGEAYAVQGCVGVGRAGVEGLAEDQDGFAMGIVLAGGIGKINVGGQREVAGGFLPEVVKGVRGAPEVGAGGGECVGAGRGIVGTGAGRGDGADVGLTFENAEALRVGEGWEEAKGAERGEGEAADESIVHGITVRLRRSGASIGQARRDPQL
jgi:hypothetical protein